jgi:hypothetical protein
LILIGETIEEKTSTVHHFRVRKICVI